MSNDDGWEDDVRSGLQFIGQTIGDAVSPLAAAFQLARRERAEAVEALRGTLEFLDTQGVRPTWAHDRATLEDARAVLARLTTERTPPDAQDGDSPTDSAGGPAGRPAGSGPHGAPGGHWSD